MNPEHLVQKIQEIITCRGAESYLGEGVTMEEHMLQSAMLAEAEDGSDEAIAAALLHDIGHYSGEFSEDALELGQNNYHEEAGSNLLQDIFPEEVVDPVKLHVTAKRYLCTINSNYLSCLSEASIHSLHLQGGPLKAEEVNAFEKNKHLDLCLKLRHWDDAAKIPGTKTPSFNHYLHVLKRLVQPA